jgi:predicted membrane protein
MNAPTVPAGAAAPRIQWPSLAVALVIMVAGTLYPPLMADAAGKADHNLAMALFWAMSAGFVPRLWVWRAIFSGWACAVALLLAAVLKLQH